MTEAPQVSHCANPECASEFRRLSQGRLAVFAIDDPAKWGLPQQTRQKAVWLCDGCAAQMYVRLDRRRYAVRVVHKRRPRDVRAA